jgi:hypothetical protein
MTSSEHDWSIYSKGIAKMLQKKCAKSAQINSYFLQFAWLIDRGCKSKKLQKGGEKRSDRFATTYGTQSSQKSGPIGKVSRKSDKRFFKISRIQEFSEYGLT